MHRRTLTAALALLLVLPACAGRADRAAPEAQAVLDALRTQGQADVMIALRPPEGFAEGDRLSETVRAEIARIQQGVLDTMDPDDFTLRVQYVSVPALAGTLRTEAGLRILSNHPDVRAVGLDVGGGGHGGDA